MQFPKFFNAGDQHISPIEDKIKYMIESKIKCIREDILLGVITINQNQIKNNTIETENNCLIDEGPLNLNVSHLNSVNDQIVKNMHKSFKLNISSQQRKKIVFIS